MSTRSHRHTAADRLIVALDCMSLRSAAAMATQLRGLVRTMKVGSILFTACGPPIIRRLRRLGFEIMLDLKFFDIPSTVEFSCRAAVHHRVSMLTVHASGEPAMLEAAVRSVRTEAAHARVPRPRVLGVTVLTSVGEGRSATMARQVMALAEAAVRAGCDGVVASAQEAAALRRRFGQRLQIVCPGIRLPHTATGDQYRVATPHAAIANGADFLVVGRPITTAARPRVAAQHILEDMEDAQC